jgi:hypothetical protein
MRLADFESLVRRLAEAIPEEFMAGVAEVVVSPRTVAHPDRGEIFTLGECIPLPTSADEPEAIQSRVVLYHGSFGAVARDQPDFDWEDEAWETLTHEIRHHVEWRARTPTLEDLDEAVEQNYARMAGEPFDPWFYRDGERMPGGLFRVEDDYFMELRLAAVGGTVRFPWAGEQYQVTIPEDLSLPGFLSVEGLKAAPAGELVLVVVRPRRLRDVLRVPDPDQRVVRARAD